MFFLRKSRHFSFLLFISIQDYKALQRVLETAGGPQGIQRLGLGNIEEITIELKGENKRDRKPGAGPTSPDPKRTDIGFLVKGRTPCFERRGRMRSDKKQHRVQTVGYHGRETCVAGKITGATRKKHEREKIDSRDSKSSTTVG